MQQTDSVCLCHSRRSNSHIEHQQKRQWRTQRQRKQKRNDELQMFVEQRKTENDENR